MIKKKRERKQEKLKKLIEAKLQRLQGMTWAKLQEETLMTKKRLRVDLLKTIQAPIQRQVSLRLSKTILARWRADLYRWMGEMTRKN